jgi:hypothetical protein
MKRFRFSLDSYLRLLRRQMEEAEARLVQLRTKQAESQQTADGSRRQRQDALAEWTSRPTIHGGELATLDAWRTGLAQRALNSERQATEMNGPIEQATAQATALRRRVELIDRLRKRRLADHRRLEDRESEQLAAELFLGNLRRRRR